MKSKDLSFTFDANVDLSVTAIFQVFYCFLDVAGLLSDLLMIKPI